MKCIVVKIISLDAMLTQVTVLMHLVEMLIGIITSVWTKWHCAITMWTVLMEVMKILPIVSIHCYYCHLVFALLVVHDMMYIVS